MTLTAERAYELLLNSPQHRRAAARTTTVGFMGVYLSPYCSLPSAPFHYELSAALDDPALDLVEIIGFRDSAKSAYATLAFPLRAALTGQYKFIVLINDTEEQVLLTMDNLRHELENNPLVRRDFPELSVRKTWSKFNVLLSNGVRIVGKSRGQNIRGIRHRQTRPDLIVVDDPENLKQVRQKRNRDLTEAWFNAEVMPAKSAFGAKLVVIGNLLHNDGFIARLSKNALFKVLWLPCLDDLGVPLWLAKYPTPAAIARKKAEVGATAWAREYMLKPVSELEQLVKESDIVRYPNATVEERSPDGRLRHVDVLRAATGIDLAISEKETADFFAGVSAYKAKWQGRDRIFILPNPVHARLDFAATQKRVKEVAGTMPLGWTAIVEDVGYQKAAIQVLRAAGIPVNAVRPVNDKRSRLQSVLSSILDGTVVFPESGCERLIEQLVNFGVDEHDDLVDALVYVIAWLTAPPVAMAGGKMAM